MASPARQSFLLFTKKLNSFAKFTTVTSRQIKPGASTLATRGCMTLKSAGVNFNRSIHCSSRAFKLSVADQEMSNVLDREIKDESQKTVKAQNIKGWKTETDGANVTLTKSHGNEQLKITLSVNNSVFVPGLESEELEEGQEAAPVSRPNFDVDIIKSSDKTLRLVCEFQDGSEIYDDQEEEAEDEFDIVEVQFFEGEQKEKDFFITGESLDGDVYNLLYDMLDERGVNKSFAQELIEFSTNYEHSLYVDFLKRICTFIKEN